MILYMKEAFSASFLLHHLKKVDAWPRGRDVLPVSGAE